MKKAKIYSPTRNVMQSCLSKDSKWKLVFAKSKDSRREFLMGWASSFDTNAQVVLYFITKEEAIQYAEKNNLDYEVVSTSETKKIPNSGTFNFTKNRNLYY